MRSAPILSGLIVATELGVLFRAGPLPNVLPTSLEILKLAGGASWDEGTSHRFTGGLPSEWGALTNLKELTMANCSLDGKLLSTGTERLRIFADIDFVFPGTLPAELGKLINLTALNVSDNRQFDHSGRPIPGTGLSGLQLVAPGC